MTTPFRIGGRIVWAGGKSNKPLEQHELLDPTTRQPRMKRDGSGVRKARSFGLAIPSQSFLDVIWPVMYAEAQRFFPHGTFPQNFAWKYKDSNTYDKGNPAKGIPPKLYSEREGYAGCHVLSVQSEYDEPTPVYVWQNNSWVQVPWDSLKVGDYIELDGTIEAHNEATPGLYVNPKGIQFTGVGTAIVGAGFDPTASFGAGPAAVPQGAQAPTVGANAPSAPPPPAPGQPPAPATPPAPGTPPSPGQPAGSFTPPPPGQPPAAPGAVPPPPNGAGTPTSTPGMPTVSHGNPPPPAPPVNGFHAGQPQPPAPPPAPPAAPPSPPQRVQAGVDQQGRPYYFVSGNSGEVTY